jgi:hypothetical protein
MAKIRLTRVIPKIGSGFISLLQNLKIARRNKDNKIQEALAEAGNYIAEKSNRWEKNLKQAYQSTEDELYAAIVRQLDYFIGIYEIIVWGKGKMGCQACGGYYPSFLRQIDSDEGILCNRCWYKK